MSSEVQVGVPLRAAELHSFGMEGVGRILESYRDGILTDDDEVALVHGPADRLSGNFRWSTFEPR